MESRKRATRQGTTDGAVGDGLLPMNLIATMADLPHFVRYSSQEQLRDTRNGDSSSLGSTSAGTSCVGVHENLPGQHPVGGFGPRADSEPLGLFGYGL